MWCIVWNVAGKISQDSLNFETYEQAEKYAGYYAHLLRLHDQGRHIQRRFHCEKNQKMGLKITYNIIKKLKAQPRPQRF